MRCKSLTFKSGTKPSYRDHFAPKGAKQSGPNKLKKTSITQNKRQISVWGNVVYDRF